MEIQLPKRKNIRLKCYDYTQAGYYFITLCTKERKPILWTDEGASDARPVLTNTGALIEKALRNIETIYNQIYVDQYVIMPNHVHFILVITKEQDNGRPMVAPTISRVVQQLKGYVIKNCLDSNFAWQKSYYEHIVRNEQELHEIREYIVNNPTKWMEDKYYKESFHRKF